MTRLFAYLDVIYLVVAVVGAEHTEWSDEPLNNLCCCCESRDDDCGGGARFEARIATTNATATRSNSVPIAAGIELCRDTLQKRRRIN